MTGESQHSHLGGLQNRTTKPPASKNKETKKKNAIHEISGISDFSSVMQNEIAQISGREMDWKKAGSEDGLCFAPRTENPVFWPLVEQSRFVLSPKDMTMRTNLRPRGLECCH